MSFLVLFWKPIAGALFILLVIATHLGLVHRAVGENDEKWEGRLAEERAGWALRKAALEKKQGEVVTKTIIQYRDRVRVEKEKADEVEKLVPKADTGLDAILSPWMRVHHDAAATGNVPGDPEGAIRAAKGIDAVTYAATLGDNYKACRAEYEKLIALQNLVSGLARVVP